MVYDLEIYFMKYDSIIFDLDGTLWDGSETMVKAFNDALHQVGINVTITAQTVRDFSGMKMDDIFAKHFGFVPKEELQAFEEVYSQKEKEYIAQSGGKLYPHVKETLDKLKENYRLFIVSNCMKGYIESFLNFYNLGSFFQDFECFGNQGFPKAKNIRLIVERNHLQHPVYVGDTIWDKESADKAGVDFVHAAYGFGKIENPKLKIQKFEDLLLL